MEDNYKKGNAFHVYKVLERHSDEDHPLTHEKIKEYMQIDFNVSLERKAIAAVIKNLEEMDYDICKSIGKSGIYLGSGSRVFEPSEIQYLLDSIYSSKMITERQAKSMTNHITNTLSEYEKEKYDKNSIKYVGGIYTPNQNFFYNIDLINEAIANNQKIKYTSISYDNLGNKVERYGGYALTITPYYTVNSQGNYYLICGRKRRGENKVEASVMRMDKLDKVTVLKNEKADDIREVEGLGNGFNISDYIQKHIYLFGGNTVKAKVLIHDDNRARPSHYNPKSNAISYVKEWFGDSVRIYEENNETYADILCNENALTIWARQYYNYVTIVEPKETKEKIINQFKDALKDYEK